MLISNESGSNNVITKIVIFIIIAEFVKQAKPFIKTASIYRPAWAPPNANCLQWYWGETSIHRPGPPWVCPLSQLRPSMISGHSSIQHVWMVSLMALLKLCWNPLDQARPNLKWKSSYIELVLLNGLALFMFIACNKRDAAYHYDLFAVNQLLAKGFFLG